jgi:O-antigen ligase
MVGVAWKASQASNPNVKYWKLMAYLYIFAAIVITAVSGSRGSFISLLVTFTAFWFWKPTRVLGKVSYLYLIIIGLILPFMYKTVIDRFTSIDQMNTLLGGREALWSAAWLYIKNNPWIGVGIGNSNYVMLTYLQLLRSTLGLDYASVHNPILTIWMETGIPGLVLYLGGLTSAVALFTRQYYKSKRINNDRLNPYFGIVAAVFLGYMFSWLKGGGVESSNTYFLMLALLLIPSGFFPNQSVDQSNRK